MPGPEGQAGGQARGDDVARALPAIARLLDVGSNDQVPDDVVGRLKRLEERCAEASSDCRSLSEEVAEAGAKLAVAAREFVEERGPAMCEADRRLLSAVAQVVSVAAGAAGVDMPFVLPDSGGDGEPQYDAAYDMFGHEVELNTGYCSRCGVQWGSYSVRSATWECSPLN
jgi:hypothetical protein